MWRQLEADSAKKYDADAARKKVARDPSAGFQLKNMTYFLCPSAVVSDTSALLAHCRMHSLRRAHDRTSANARVVKDTSAPGRRALWCSMLGGGVLCDLACFLHKKEGSSTAYKRAVAVKRRVWVSDGFQTSHPELSRIIKAKMQEAGSQWRPLKSQAAALAAGEQCARQGRPGNVLVFVSSAEQRSRDYEPVELKITASDAEALFANIDRTRSLGNMCGR